MHSQSLWVNKIVNEITAGITHIFTIKSEFLQIHFFLCSFSRIVIDESFLFVDCVEITNFIICLRLLYHVRCSEMQAFYNSNKYYFICTYCSFQSLFFCCSVHSVWKSRKCHYDGTFARPFGSTIILWTSKKTICESREYDRNTQRKRKQFIHLMHISSFTDIGHHVTAALSSTT